MSTHRQGCCCKTCDACWRVSYTYPNIYVWLDSAWHKLPYTHYYSENSKSEYTLHASGTADLLLRADSTLSCASRTHSAQTCTDDTSHPAYAVTTYSREDAESPWVLESTNTPWYYRFTLIWRCATRSLEFSGFMSQRIIPPGGGPAIWYESYGWGLETATLPETGSDCAAFDGTVFTKALTEPTDPGSSSGQLWHDGSGTVTITQITCTNCPGASYVWQAVWHCTAGGWIVSQLPSDMTAPHGWTDDPYNGCRKLYRSATDTPPDAPDPLTGDALAACCGYDVWAAVFVFVWTPLDCEARASGGLPPEGEWTVTRYGSSATNDYPTWTQSTESCLLLQTVPHGAAAPAAPTSPPDWYDCLIPVYYRDVPYGCSAGVWAAGTPGDPVKTLGTSAYCPITPIGEWLRGSGCSFTYRQYTASGTGVPAAQYAAAIRTPTFDTPPADPPIATAYAATVAAGSCTVGPLTLSWSSFEVTLDSTGCCAWYGSQAVTVLVNGGDPTTQTLTVTLAASGTGWALTTNVPGGCSRAESLSNMLPDGTYSGGSVVS